MNEVKKKVLGIAVVLMAVAMLALPICTVYAESNLKFIDVSGLLKILGGGVPAFKPAGKSGNVILVISGNSVEWTGGIEGTGSADGHFLIHNFGTPDSWNTAINIHILEAEVEGKSGTLTIISAGSDMHGHWRILSGTGELANLHGQGTWEPITVPVLYSYEGQVHFDP